MCRIFGGGFELGWSSMYDGVGLINNGVSQGKPFIFVAVNYRVGGFGELIPLNRSGPVGKTMYERT